MQCGILLGPQRSISQHTEHTQNTLHSTFSLQWFCTHATFALGNQVSFPWNVSLRCPAGQHREHTSFATCQPQTCKMLHDRGPKLVTWKMINFQILRVFSFSVKSSSYCCSVIILQFWGKRYFHDSSRQTANFRWQSELEHQSEQIPYKMKGNYKAGTDLGYLFLSWFLPSTCLCSPGEEGRHTSVSP